MPTSQAKDKIANRQDANVDMSGPRSRADVGWPAT